jgi:gliding motility-associated protein GldM
VAILDIAKEVQGKTLEVMKDLRDLKEEMVEVTGGRDPETNKLLGAADYDKVSTMMLQQKGPTGKTKGVELQRLLNDYAQFLVGKTGSKYSDEFPPIAEDAKDIPEFASDPNQKDKRFPELFFENTPTAAGMASVSYLETEVMNYERKALEILADSVGAGEVSFNLIFPLIRPESNIVAAGGRYTAKMFIAASSSALKPDFYRDGKKLESSDMEIGGGELVKYGEISFVASPGAYKNGLAEKSFNAKVDLDGKTYEINETYFVAKPTIIVSSSALSALWKNCGNALNVQVPSLGNSYNPVITTSNATAVKGTAKGEITIIPKTRGKVVMSVKNSGNLIGTKTFTVKDIPLPRYEMAIPRAAGNEADGVKARAFRSVTVNAKPEPSFASDVPKDARYRVREVEVKLVRNGDPVKVQTFKTNKINLTSYAQTARKGDLYIFTIKKVIRTNFQSKSENVPVRNQIYKVLVNAN